MSCETRWQVRNIPHLGQPRRAGGGRYHREMRAFAEFAYPGLGIIAMLAHILIVGPLSLFALYLEPFRAYEIPTVVLKALIVVSWCGFGFVGIRAWRARSWAVIPVPIVSFGIIWFLMDIGISNLGWTLRWF